jgi:hypothetical protein
MKVGAGRGSQQRPPRPFARRTPPETVSTTNESFRKNRSVSTRGNCRKTTGVVRETYGRRDRAQSHLTRDDHIRHCPVVDPGLGPDGIRLERFEQVKLWARRDSNPLPEASLGVCLASARSQLRSSTFVASRAPPPRRAVRTASPAEVGVALLYQLERACLNGRRQPTVARLPTLLRHQARWPLSLVGRAQPPDLTRAQSKKLRCLHLRQPAFDHPPDHFKTVDLLAAHTDQLGSHGSGHRAASSRQNRTFLLGTNRTFSCGCYKGSAEYERSVNPPRPRSSGAYGPLPGAGRASLALDRFHVEVISPLSLTIDLVLSSRSRFDHFNQEAV